MSAKAGARSDVAPRAIPEDDPLWRAAMAAPIDTTPLTEQERADLDESARAGGGVSQAEMTARIEQRRPR